MKKYLFILFLILFFLVFTSCRRAIGERYFTNDDLQPFNLENFVAPDNVERYYLMENIDFEMLICYIDIFSKEDLDNYFSEILKYIQTKTEFTYYGYTSKPGWSSTKYLSTSTDPKDYELYGNGYYEIAYSISPIEDGKLNDVYFIQLKYSEEDIVEVNDTTYNLTVTILKNTTNTFYVALDIDKYFGYYIFEECTYLIPLSSSTIDKINSDNANFWVNITKDTFEIGNGNPDDTRSYSDIYYDSIGYVDVFEPMIKSIKLNDVFNTNLVAKYQPLWYENNNRFSTEYYIFLTLDYLYIGEYHLISDKNYVSWKILKMTKVD